MERHRDAAAFPAPARTNRRFALRTIGAGGLAAGLLSFARLRGTSALAVQQGTAAATLDWRLSGNAMEACRCAVTCPCNFGSDPTEIPCGAIIAWHIANGHYGDTGLDDLNLVAYLQIPGNAFKGGWTLGYYFDQRADAKQLSALEAIFSGQAGGWPALLTGLVTKPLAPKQERIEFEVIDENARVSVPDLLEVATERVPNPLPGAPPLDLTVSNLAVPFYTGTVNVRRSTTLKLTDPNLSFEYPGRSSLIGKFEYSGP